MKKFTASNCAFSFVGLMIAAVFGCIGNFVSKGIPISVSIPALMILVVIGFAGQLISMAIKSPFPAFFWVMLLGTIVSLPFSPIADLLTKYVLQLNMMALVTPILGYAGLTVGFNFKNFMKLSWKAVIIGILVIFGTWFWSALIAEVLLKATGYI